MGSGFTPDLGSGAVFMASMILRFLGLGQLTSSMVNTAFSERRPRLIACLLKVS